jgi:hypothetical protein
MVLSEFEERPSGLFLPHGKILKRYDSNRIRRVLWKITRGLFFDAYKKFLPEDKPKNIKVAIPGEDPPPTFLTLANCESKGLYPGVFDYRFFIVPELNSFHLCGMILWSNLKVLVAFHDPQCSCEACTQT